MMQQRWIADHTVAVQILVEGGFQRSQRSAGSRHDADGIRDEIAAAVGIPCRVLIGPRILPGHCVATCRLLRADRCPAPSELAGNHGRAEIFQFRPRPAVKIKITSNLDQVGRSNRLDHGGSCDNSIQAGSADSDVARKVDGKVGDTISVCVSFKYGNAATTIKKVVQLSGTSVEGGVAYEAEVIMGARRTNRIDTREIDLIDSGREV